MADVYKAVDVMENRTVAVKILSLSFHRTRNFSDASETRARLSLYFLTLIS